MTLKASCFERGEKRSIGKKYWIDSGKLLQLSLDAIKEKESDRSWNHEQTRYLVHLAVSPVSASLDHSFLQIDWYNQAVYKLHEARSRKMAAINAPFARS